LGKRAEAEKKKVAHTEEVAKKATIQKQLKEEEAKKRAEQRAEMVKQVRGEREKEKGGDLLKKADGMSAYVNFDIFV